MMRRRLCAIIIVRMLFMQQCAYGTSDIDQTCEVEGTDALRVWIDEHKFKQGEIIPLVSGAFTNISANLGGPRRKSPSANVTGDQAMNQWDILWTTARQAEKVFPNLKAGQKVNRIPGMTAITRKGDLARSLLSAYNEDSYRLVPPSFPLPDELETWKTWKDPDCQGSSEACLWILKTNKHLGKGITILPRHDAERKVTSNRTKYVVSQKYIDSPLLINGRKFGIRLWALVTSLTPMQSYLHSRGLVLFSSTDFAQARNSATGGGPIPTDGHLTNAFQNSEGQVWTLPELRTYLGNDNYTKIWQQMKSITGRTLAAGLKGCRAEEQRLGVLRGTTFQLIGLDFLVKSDLSILLIEANGTPSTSLHGADKVGVAKLESEKGSMLGDLVRLIAGSYRTTGGIAPGDETPVNDETVRARSMAKYLRSQRSRLETPAVYSTVPQNLQHIEDLKGVICQSENKNSPEMPDSFTKPSGDACFPCLNWDHIEMIAALEQELSDRGAFVPVIEEFHHFCLGKMNMLPAGASGWNLPCHSSDRLIAAWSEAKANALAISDRDAGSTGAAGSQEDIMPLIQSMVCV